MNHVPDAVIEAIDRFGRAVLRADPGAVDVQLRSDVWVHLEWDAAALAAGRVEMTVAVEHPNPADSLDGYGPFLGERLAGVETQLRSWGIDPPDDYERVGTDDDGRALYAGDLNLPG